jgi:hypothetical protein
MLKKILKWTGIVLGSLIAVLLVANAVFVWRSGAALESRLQTIRDAGHPLCLADLAREPIPPEKNAAVYYRRARGDLQAISHELEAVRKSDGWPYGALSLEDLQTIERAMSAYPDVISLVRKAADCPDSYSDTDYGVTVVELWSSEMGGLAEVQSDRSVARYLGDRCLMLTAKGDRDEALRTCILGLQLSRHLDNEPLLMAHGVAMIVRRTGIATANRVLRSGPVGDSARDALDAELARHDLTEAYRQALITERGCGLACLKYKNRGHFWPVRGFWNNAVIHYLDVMDIQLALASQPYHQVLRAGPTAVSEPLVPWDLFTYFLSQASHRAREATERNRATMRCLRILNAVTRLEQQGVEVTGFVDLKLPEEETIDPFTGKPLVMKKLPDGWVIYSVGANLKDDGGKVDDQSDVGLGPVPPLPPLE